MSTTLEPTFESTQKDGQSAAGDRRNGTAGGLLSTSAGGAAFWRSPAPKKAEADLTTGKSAWLAHLQNRRSPKLLSSLCSGESPWRWGLHINALETDVVGLLDVAEAVAKLNSGERLAKKLQRRSETAIQQWLGRIGDADQSIEFGIASLAIAHLLAHPGVHLDGDLWWRSADALAEVAARAVDWRSDADLPAQAALAQQLFSGELPLTLSYLFPEMKPLHVLRENARQRLAEGLEDLLNGEGLWHGSLSSVARPLIACWTRCRAMGGEMKKGAWTDDAEDHFQYLVTAALQWSAADGSQILTLANETTPWSPAFLQTLLRLGGDSSDKAAARELFGKKLVGDGKQNPRAAQPEPADHCEWSGLAVMRTDWSRKGPTLAVDYSGPQVRLEVVVGGQPVLIGDWSSVTKVDGKEVQPVGDWEEVCWESDEDVDYLELSIELTGGATLERQILLAHDEDFIVLADNVKETAGERVEHAWQLPLAGQRSYRGEEETCEAHVVDSEANDAKPLARLIPMALPEWRADSSRGRMECNRGAVRIEQRQFGRAISAPLLIDFKPRRILKPCTWRQLTVAESLKVVPRDVAAAFRVQCGKDQYLIYRSLAPAANRTFIGQNVSCECLFAKFLPPTGDIEELLEIEA